MGNPFSKPDKPASPNYGQAAEATAAANRTNINTPNGSLTYSQGPNGMWNANVALSPEQQALQAQQNRTSMNLAGLQDQATGRVGQTMGTEFDQSNIARAPVNAGTTGQQAIEARMNPQFERDENALRNRLANQGIMPGSEAYNSELDTFNRGRNDARSQASLQGIGLDTQARQQGFQEQSYLRGLPMNELNALRSGSQVSSPQFNQVPQNQGANYLAAAQLQGNDNMAGYNAASASQNNMMGGLWPARFQSSRTEPWMGQSHPCPWFLRACSEASPGARLHGVALAAGPWPSGVRQHRGSSPGRDSCSSRWRGTVSTREQHSVR